MTAQKQSGIALVTGGTRGIGEAICKMFSGEGYQVVTTFRNKERERQAREWQSRMADDGLEIDLVKMDVSDMRSCEIAADELLQRYGRLDVLVNNAGITRDSVMKKMPIEAWQEVIHTNLDGVFNVTRCFLDTFLAQHYGRIINISSINAQKGQFGQVNYSAAKAGIHGFTKALAQETARKGITVNTISPGYVETDMIMAIDEKIREQIKAQIPVGRFGQPEEIARLVAFLANEQSSFITGADFSINGGMFMH
ncbi:beta-ketoacyl-ACP reductase [Marinobacter guineae]|uniref:2,3-dihydroxy-2,3-dihydro-p-cumate dehydrogenase n=1 Tax=Marinobacter guineae TaxID=432303 RepID=A0A2G1VFZ9_9GAMM|nr:acetoacetyl-CoA reductase [Marinobacter guineae]PHQ25707.1 beta-ketoacyl-ACP reductase [Marinobacter guineae]